MGGLKKLEHDDFRRKHGYVLPSSGGGSGSGGVVINPLVNAYNPHPSNLRPRAHSVIVPPKLYMKMNQFGGDAGGPMAPTVQPIPSTNFPPVRTPSTVVGVGIGNAAVMAHNFGNFARRERAVTSQTYRF